MPFHKYSLLPPVISLYTYINSPCILFCLHLFSVPLVFKCLWIVLSLPSSILYKTDRLISNTRGSLTLFTYHDILFSSALMLCSHKISPFLPLFLGAYSLSFPLLGLRILYLSIYLISNFLAFLSKPFSPSAVHVCNTAPYPRSATAQVLIASILSLLNLELKINFNLRKFYIIFSIISSSNFLHPQILIHLTDQLPVSNSVEFHQAEWFGLLTKACLMHSTFSVPLVCYLLIYVVNEKPSLNVKLWCGLERLDFGERWRGAESYAELLR